MRDPLTGRYAFDGDFGRKCRCGHALGVHVHGGYECMNADRGVDGADGTPCDCAKFRPATGKRASARKG